MKLSLPENNQLFRFFLLSKKRLVLSCSMAIVIFLALSYNLSFPVSEDVVSSPNDSILFRFHTYGAQGVLYTFGIAALLYLWFSFFGAAALIRSKSLVVLAVLFGLLNTAALHLFYRNMLPRHSVSATVLFFGQAVVWTLLFLLFSRFVLMLFETVSVSFSSPGQPQKEASNNFIKWYDRHAGFFAFAVILFCWSPWIISYYPASMEWDVYDPILQFLGQKPADNHHPWFYACAVGGAYKLGLALGDKNIGIFLYTILRALVMAAIYARCVSLQQKNGVPRWISLATILFFAVTPVWGAYAKHAFKDSIAAALFCWFLLALIEVVLQIHKGKLSIGTCLEYSAATVFAALFRNNIIYVVIPVTLVLLLIVLMHRFKLRYSVLLLLGVLLFQCYQSYIFNVLQIQPGNAREALSIPIQQTARTVKLYGDTITEDEQAILLDYFPKNNFRSYDPIISDPIKNNSNDTHQSFGDYIPYLKTWGKMFFRFPYTYLEAFIAHSSGYYAFTPEYTEEQRFGHGDHSNVGMTIFNWVEDVRFDPSFVCHYSEKFAGERRILDNWPEIWHQIPLLNLTDMKPLYTWVVVLMAWLFFRRKEHLKLLPICAWLLMMLTCAASPVNDCFRYFAPAAASFPALITLLRRDVPKHS